MLASFWTVTMSEASIGFRIDERWQALDQQLFLVLQVVHHASDKLPGGSAKFGPPTITIAVPNKCADKVLQTSRERPDYTVFFAEELGEIAFSTVTSEREYHGLLKPVVIVERVKRVR